MSEAQEIELGKSMDGEVRRQMGLYEDAELQRYVESIGMRLASASQRPNLPWHFTVVDEPAVNAFALPGGYIYVTRGILPFLDTEADLAGVLGHEIGHVTARHSAQQYTKATSAGLGVQLLSIFVPEAQPFQGLTETALGVLFLKHGRDDELQADRLGVDYTAKTGWNPAGVGSMLRTLSRLDEAGGSRRGVPNWLSTHPAPADRVQKVQAYIAQSGIPAARAQAMATTWPSCAASMASCLATAPVRASSAAIRSCTRFCGCRSRSRKAGRSGTRANRSWRRRRTATSS